MAEGFALALKGNHLEPYSAGVEPHGMNPRAVRAMSEAGIDISKQWSKHVDGKVKRVHVGFDDPPRLAKDAKDEEDAMRHYRRVRDEIKAWVETLPGSLR
jgi:arsenate reductase (thioredoxin)